ncbi:hypothetical protein BJD12_13025 [Xanthomonas vesicatoria ATCC 35937]|nr:DUF4431 domain-containing protein [Xanthomonas vesicatoria]APP75999.1 hypothetical protein BJD12_13025 [Xanthomonas vesicatoria ATCC 35937]KTF34999.1 hypothetical protein LMG920_04145 [Xanthomonas vesicatoria]MCC8597328.1 DUF4431 domain-containing protein [Xanthomonas vesicatoria]MCC8607281.1 DUF4431 domain-containing protein [Xanthomonas vesicatoria]
MKASWRLMLILCGLIAAPACAQSYRYGAPEVTLRGTLISATGQTPDGAEIMYPALQLAAPLTVEATDGNEDLEPRATGITPLQLSLDATTMRMFKQMKGHQAQVSGTLFHSDNGHHYTDVLLSVTSVSAKY